MARLSICIPTYNRSTLLRQALDSLCDQGLARGDYAVLVSDNASQDDTPATVREFAERLTIRYQRNPENLGFARNLQLALGMCDTPFLVLLPDDDLIAPGHLGRALSALERRQSASLVASLTAQQEYPGMPGTAVYGELPRATAQTSFSTPYVWQQAEWFGASLLNTPLSLIGSVFKTDAYRRCERWKRYPIWGDRLLLAEMGLHGDVITLPWIAGYYRISAHQNNGLHGDRRAEFQQVTADLLTICQEHRIPVIEFWAEQLVRSTPGHRSQYLERLKYSVPDEIFQRITNAAEGRLGTRLRIGVGRLEQLGVPHSVARFIRAGRDLFNFR